jgi:hypothetical protein
MKKNTRTLFALGFFLTLAAISAQAQTDSKLKGHVPFDFNVGGQTLPAGDYVIERVSRQTSQEAVLIRSADGHARVLVRMSPTQAATAPEQSKLIFSSYGERHFLSQVFVEGDRLGLELPRSTAERALRRKLREGRPHRQEVALTTTLRQ